VRREIPDLRFLADMRRSPLSLSSEIGRLCFRSRQATSHFSTNRRRHQNLRRMTLPLLDRRAVRCGALMVDCRLPGVIWLTIRFWWCLERPAIRGLFLCAIRRE